MKQRIRATTIRASEVGSFLFCRRAWHYQRSGVESQNQERMNAGTRMHEAHGKAVFTAGIYRLLGYGALLAGMVMLAIYLIDFLI